MTEANKIKCIALDLDGTTLNSRGQLSARTKQAIERALEKQAHVIVASGRPLESLPEEVTELPGIRYAVTSNGALVWDLQSKEILREYKLTPESVEAILELTAAMDVAYETFIRGKAYAQASYVEDPVRYGAAPGAVPYIQRTREPVEDMGNFIRQHKEELDSIDIVIRDGKEELWKTIETQVREVYVTSSVPQLLEIAYKEAGKAPAVGFLLEHLGLKREELAAFGDGDNDKELLRLAGTGVAVGNAVLGCKAMADWIAGSNDEDGVAVELERMFKDGRIESGTER